MVTSKSANQLKTPAKVFWAFKMVSQFGSVGYTIMGKTADLTVVQKTIIDSLHKEGKPQTFIAKEAGCSQSAVSKHVEWKEKVWKKKMHNQPRVPHAALWELSSKIDSRIWVNFTRIGLRLGSRHQEPPHTDVSRNLSTVVIRSVLKSGGRVEKLIAQVAWNPMLSFHSLWWFGVQCHLLVLVHFVFRKPTSLHPFTKKFWSTSCFLLLTSFLKMLISFSSKIWHMPTLPKAPKVG